MDPDDLKDARAVAGALADQALAAMTEPARAAKLVALAAAAIDLHDDLAAVIGNREQAATAVLGALQHVVIMNVRGTGIVGVDNSDAT